MWKDLGNYILNLKDKKPLKIAEIGVGKFNETFSYLNSFEDIEIIKIDINPEDDSVIYDDITNPNLDLYEDVDIIYSIRPPSELQPYLIDLKEKTNSTLIIRPLFNEDLNIGKSKMKLKNYKKASFYISLNWGETFDWKDFR